MTKREAWRFLAAKWRNPQTDGSVLYVRINDSYCYGLCRSVKNLYHLVDQEVITEMVNQIPPSYSTYLWPLDEVGAAERVKFCEARVEES